MQAMPRSAKVTDAFYLELFYLKPYMSGLFLLSYGSLP